MRVSLVRTGLLVLAILATGLSACLTSEEPKLDVGDLRQPDGLGGNYIASSFPGDEKEAQATVAALGDRSYLLNITEDGHKDSPVHVRFLDLGSGQLLAVLTEEATADSAMYAFVTRASSGAWVFRAVDLKPERRDIALQEVVSRHGGGVLAYDSADHPSDRIPGTFSAANLRALFTDPDFLQAINTDHLFRLSRAD